MSLQSLAAQHRQAILAREVPAATSLDSLYNEAWWRLLKRLLKLFDQMQTAQQQAEDAGQPWNASTWWYSFHRLDQLLWAAQQDFATFTETATKVVQSFAGEALKVGESDALELLDVKLPKMLFGKPSEQALAQLANTLTSQDAKIAKLFSRMDNQAADIVRKRLLAGLALGENPRQVAYDIQKGLQIPLNRALTIARTEMMNAYRTAALGTYRANSDVVTGWTWSAAEGACPFCSEMNGTHHTLDETLDSHPNCRCAMVPDTVSNESILAEFASEEEAA